MRWNAHLNARPRGREIPFFNLQQYCSSRKSRRNVPSVHVQLPELDSVRWECSTGCSMYAGVLCRRHVVCIVVAIEAYVHGTLGGDTSPTLGSAVTSARTHSDKLGALIFFGVPVDVSVCHLLSSVLA